MSALPKRKKSPEEIASLRQSLGVHALSAEPDTVQVVEPASQQTMGFPPTPAAITTYPPPGSESRLAKPVRSLRKSEQQALPPIPHHEPPPDSRLPLYRHSPDEIADLHRRDVLSLMNAAPNPRLLPAHPALIISGYLMVVAGAAGCWFYQFPPAATAACAVAALAVAALIKHNKPVSVHHAAFIAVAALFLIVFSALHYFPQLRHAT